MNQRHLLVPIVGLILIIVALLILVWLGITTNELNEGIVLFDQEKYDDAIAHFTTAISNAKDQNGNPRIPFYTAATYAALAYQHPVDKNVYSQQAQYYYNEITWEWARKKSRAPEEIIKELWKELRERKNGGVQKCQFLASVISQNEQGFTTCLTYSTPVPSSPMPIPGITSTPTPSGTATHTTIPTSTFTPTPTASLTPTPPTPLVLRPGLAWPYNGYSQSGMCRGLEFSWSASLGEYSRISVYGPGANEGVIAGGDVPSPSNSWILTNGVEAAGEYRWQVFVLDDNKRPVSASDIRRFKCSQ